MHSFGCDLGCFGGGGFLFTASPLGCRFVREGGERIHSFGGGLFSFLGGCFGWSRGRFFFVIFLNGFEMGQGFGSVFFDGGYYFGDGRGLSFCVVG